MTLPLMMKFEEARAQLRVSRATMLTLINNGQLVAYKIGNCWRFKPEHVEQAHRLYIPQQEAVQA